VSLYVRIQSSCHQITVVMSSSLPCKFADVVAIDDVKKLYRDGMIKPQCLKEGHCLSIRVVGLQKIARDKGILVPSTRAFKEVLGKREDVFVKHAKFTHDGSQSYAVCFKRSNIPTTQTQASRVRLGAEEVELMEDMLTEEALIHLQSVIIPAGYHVERGPLLEEPMRRKKKAEHSDGQATADLEEHNSQKLKRVKETMAAVQQSQPPEPSMLVAASESMVGSDAGVDVCDGDAGCKEERFYVRFEDNPVDRYIDENLHVFKGQKEPVVLDKDQMSAFLMDEVDVYHMKVVRRTSDYGLRLEFYRDDTPRTRLEFIEEYTAWFASSVLGVDDLGSLVGLDLEHRRAVVDAALSSLEKLVKAEGKDALHKHYHEFAFKGKQSELGMYAKDKTMTTATQSMLIGKPAELSKLGMYTDTFRGFVHRDLLHHIGPDVSGVGIRKSWVYSGGFGLAGFHVEDGFLHFGHHILDFVGEVQDAYEQRLVSFWLNHSKKIWIFKQGASKNDIVQLNSELFDKVVCKQSKGKQRTARQRVGVCDEVLMSRSVVIDPEFAERNGYVVVDHYPGQCIVSNYPHTVLGFALFSFAWNFCLPEHVPYYIGMERATADIYRANHSLALTRYKELDVPYKRAFLVSSALVWGVFSKQYGRFANDWKKVARDLWCIEKAEFDVAWRRLVDSLHSANLLGDLLPPESALEGLEVDAPLYPQECQCNTCLAPIIAHAWYSPGSTRKDTIFFCSQCATPDLKLMYIWSAVEARKRLT